MKRTPIPKMASSVLFMFINIFVNFRALAADPTTCTHALGGSDQSGQDLQLSARPGNLLWDTWSQASRQREGIVSFVQGLRGADKSYFEKILKGVDANLSKFQTLYANSRRPDKLDTARHMAILNAIAEFDPQSPRFSLYKIKRKIEGRYSLQEYIDCK